VVAEAEVIETHMSTAVVFETKSFAPAEPQIQNCCRPLLSAMLILAADCSCLSAIVVTSVVLGSALGGGQVGSACRQLWPLLPLFPLLYWLFDVYPGVSLSPVDELKRVTLANAGVFMVLVAFLVLKHSSRLPVLDLIAAWLSVSIAIPVVRSLVRQLGSGYEWWGYPVILFGSGEMARTVLKKLKDHPEIGLRPVAVVEDDVECGSIQGVTVCPPAYTDRMIAFGVRHALIAAPELPQSQLIELIKRQGDVFPHLIIIPGIDGVCNVSSQTRDVMGVLSVQVRNNLLHRGSQVTKRFIDLVLCVLASVPLFPFMAIVSILIAIESRGPALYSQTRVGHNGRVFNIWKFRTMVSDASAVLQHCLDTNPALREEWEQNHKLRNDPRVTRIGAFLRKTSLDELPQLWNVIRGDMSVVGPRPIVDAEIAKYKESYWMYAKVNPGVTGMWQVSGRSLTTYSERVAYDTYYVQNWSVWLDVYLLAKTVVVVLTGYGAY
jgi:Undecaprenyl-phosphate galactose phosphotransferase WbaP